MTHNVRVAAKARATPISIHSLRGCDGATCIATLLTQHLYNLVHNRLFMSHPASHVGSLCSSSNTVEPLCSEDIKAYHDYLQALWQMCLAKACSGGLRPQKCALTASRLPDCMTVSSLSLSRLMRCALSRNSAADKKYPKSMEPSRKGLAAAVHPSVPVGVSLSCTVGTSY